MTPQERERFEKIVSDEPYCRSVLRFSNDGTKSAWPGDYRDVDVSFAWDVVREMLQARAALDAGAVEALRELVRDADEVAARYALMFAKHHPGKESNSLDNYIATADKARAALAARQAEGGGS